MLLKRYFNIVFNSYYAINTKNQYISNMKQIILFLMNTSVSGIKPVGIELPFQFLHYKKRRCVNVIRQEIKKFVSFFLNVYNRPAPPQCHLLVLWILRDLHLNCIGEPPASWLHIISTVNTRNYFPIAITFRNYVDFSTQPLIPTPFQGMSMNYQTP